MKTILALLSLTFTFGTSECANEKYPTRLALSQDAVFKQILKNKPTIDKKLAKKLTVSIRKYAKFYEMDPHRAVAIAMQETGFRNVVVKHPNGAKDYGMFQINSATANYYGIDKARIIQDIDYAVHTYFIIMKDKKKLCRYLDKDAWSCYHSKKPSLRTKYKKLVNKYYIANF